VSSIISQVLKLNAAQDETDACTKSPILFISVREQQILSMGEKAFIVSFNRLILCHALETVLTMYKSFSLSSDL